MARRCSLTALMPQPFFPWLRPIGQDDQALQASFPIASRKMFYFPGVLKHLDGRWMSRCVDRWLRTIDVTHPAVIDAHFGYPEGVGCYYAAEKHKLPIFITIRGLEVDLLRDPRMRPVLVEALQNATGVIAVSDFLKETAVNAGVDESQITVIPNGVDTERFFPGDRTSARRELGIADGQRLIVCVGTLKRVKGHDVLLKAMSAVRKGVPARLVCVGGRGDPQWADELERMVVSLGLSNEVCFVGAEPPDRVVQWLRAADVFCLASHREGCCNAVLEAVATGIHVAVTRVGDNAHVVTGPEIGLLVDPGDSEGLANAIVESLSNSHDPTVIANSVGSYSWDDAAQRVIEYFDSKLIDRSH
tara:strand:+ start:67521 stop:68600 length:1080 start_codon:yes stop_codon:yes gene_type:complete